MNDLHRVFTEATEHVGSPDLARRALAGAQRRRVRRAAAGALAAVVLVGGGVAWAVQAPAERAGVVDTPVPTPSTPTSTPSTPTTAEDVATQPIWDPFDIVDAPRAATVLPERIEPPADPPSLADQPLPDFALAWPEEGEDLRVLGSNGEWRSVEETADAIQGTFRDVVAPAITRDGDRIAMSTDAGILVVSPSGDRQVLPWPPELVGPFDGRPRLIWLPDDSGFLVMHFGGAWQMGFDGSAGPAPYVGEHNPDLMVDPDTLTVRQRRPADRELVTWEGTEVVASVPIRGYGERFVTRFEHVAYVGNPGPNRGVMKSGPVVMDPASGELLAFAPIRDPDGAYSDNVNLTPLGFTDESTVLLLVSPMDYRSMDIDEGDTHLATWDWRTGAFSLVASGDTRMRSVVVAPDLLLD